MSDLSFLPKWREDLAAGTPGVQLVEVEHPLEIYVGASDLGRARLQIRSEAKPKEPELSDLVLVERSQVGADWLLTMTLQDAQFTEVFLRLADHLVSRSRPATSPATAWRRVDDVFNEWHRILTPRPFGRLSLEALRGLIGELWLLLHVFTENRPIDQAIAGWLGPLGSPQDFVYEETGFHEAKAIGPQTTKIKISSAEQLDREVELIVLRIHEVPESTQGAVNLARLVGLVGDALDADAVDHGEFELRLKQLRVDLDDEYYTDRWFSIFSFEKYDTPAAFPAIRASDLPAGIQNVKYDIALPAISEFITVSEILA